MPTGVFILGRFFLRIENVLFRSNETRLYLEFDKGYMLSEFYSREMAFDDIKKVTNILMIIIIICILLIFHRIKS